MRIYPPYIPAFANEPTKEEFLIAIVNPTTGWGIFSRKSHAAGDKLCAYSGVVLTEVTQYTLQVSDTLHMHDPFFTGILTHSCDPNCRLDMANLSLIAVKDIAVGQLLTIDYDHTEKVLFKAFDCNCGSASCRGRVQGYAPGSAGAPTPAVTD